jgi:hypothetical protein
MLCRVWQERLEANAKRVRVVRRHDMAVVHAPSPFSPVSILSKDSTSHHGNQGMAATQDAYSGKFHR